VSLYASQVRLYTLVVARRLTILALATLVASAPLLACLPNPSMTDAEMACCKKMAGDCDMGTGNHSCCKTTVSAPQLAAIAHVPQVHQLDGLVAVQTIFVDADTSLASEVIRVVPSPIPISPPGSLSILRN
jgi:hypothetical protein